MSSVVLYAAIVLLTLSVAFWVVDIVVDVKIIRSRDKKIERLQRSLERERESYKRVYTFSKRYCEAYYALLNDYREETGREIPHFMEVDE